MTNYQVIDRWGLHWLMGRDSVVIDEAGRYYGTVLCALTQAPVRRDLFCLRRDGETWWALVDRHTDEACVVHGSRFTVRVALGSKWVASGLFTAARDPLQEWPAAFEEVARRCPEMVAY